MPQVQLQSMLGPPREASSWVFVAPAQLHRNLGALRDVEPARTGVLLVESREWLSRRPYHRARLALILLNMRHFALELAKAGFAVRYLCVDGTLCGAVRDFARRHGALQATEWAEREMRAELAPLVKEGLLRPVPDDGWATHRSDFDGCRRGRQWSMDAFYRAYRRRSGLLMDEAGEPVGGRLSFDVENRQRWNGAPPPPTPPRFRDTPLRREVAETVEVEFAAHPGTLELGALPGSLADTERLWSWAKGECLPHFGPYEDAMSTRSRGLFHSRMSPVMNLGRIHPTRMAREVECMDLPIASKEGFIRQVAGWREFVRWVHLATDGFRDAWPVADAPGDAGFARWKGSAWTPAGAPPAGVDGGARPRALGGDTPLPPVFWGAPSGLHCLDQVVSGVWDEAWSHHITRLMVLGNLATLLDVDARELADWFWVAYMDAWDWVVEPNVLAMATYAAGGVMTTKPYVAGSAYMDRMGDFCQGCEFRPDRDCPVTPLYWAFLERHQAALQSNPRLKLAMASMRKRPAERRAADAATFVHVRDVLVRGERLRPAGSLPLQ